MQLRNQRMRLVFVALVMSSAAVCNAAGGVDFVLNVQPILETNCLSCHSGEKTEGDVDLSSRETAFKAGGDMRVIVPFKPEKSALSTLTALTKDDETLMPPVKSGGPLDRKSIATLRQWIAEGAKWPDGVNLRPRAKRSVGTPNSDDMALVRRIRDVIIKRTKSENKFADYSAAVAKTGAHYSMIAIKAGEFVMGSPSTEEGRDPNEGPQIRVKVSSFWLGKYEVTWDEYEPFMVTPNDRYKNGTRKDFDPAAKYPDVDGVTSPTAPYVEMSFGMGQKGFPAISMTQHAANKYCEWLSAQTGHFYRLPTEAEWEFACRAGTTTAYSFGDDPKELGKYAWFTENSEDKYQKVGTKKPNPWGLYDMHGNVMEWTADQFVPDYYQRLKAGATNPFVRPNSLYPRSVRGGGWVGDAAQLRSANRLGSDSSWQQQDPQLPKSIWYLTDAPWVGFRLARPLEIPSVEEMYFYWSSSTDKH